MEDIERKKLDDFLQANAVSTLHEIKIKMESGFLSIPAGLDIIFQEKRRSYPIHEIESWH